MLKVMTERDSYSFRVSGFDFVFSRQKERQILLPAFDQGKNIYNTEFPLANLSRRPERTKKQSTRPNNLS
jgi:hypothetical protein